MAGDIVRGDRVWMKSTRTWTMLLENLLPRLPRDSHAAMHLRAQMESGVAVLDLTGASMSTVDELRRAIIESRAQFRSEPDARRFVESLDELIALLAD